MEENKILNTLDNLRNNAFMLRDRQNFEGIDIRLVEFLLLQAFCDMSTLARALDEASERIKVLEAPPDE